MEAIGAIVAKVLEVSFMLVIPVGILVMCGLFGMEIFKYSQTLQVTGGANEWVVIMNNGKMKQAGVGLATMISPGDTVAIFPSKVNKVTFSTAQVTKEFSGLEVSAMICWVVNREGDGPMKAYVSLGKELESQTPKNANDLISKMASSVIRNQIANSTTDEILKNRDKLRTAIKEEIGKVTTGWGVWLETIEILDAKILSRSLFNDLQCTFLEDNNKKATLLKLDVDNQLEVERGSHKLAEDKRRKDTEMVNLKRTYEQQFKEKKQAVEQEKVSIQIKKQELQQQKQEAIYNKDLQIKQVINAFALQIKANKDKVKNDLLKKAQQLDSLKQEKEFEKQNKIIAIQEADTKAEADRKTLEEQFKFRKELLAQPGYLDKRRAQALNEIYKQYAVRNANVYQISNSDPICKVIDTMTQQTTQGMEQ